VKTIFYVPVLIVQVNRRYILSALVEGRAGSGSVQTVLPSQI